MVLGNFEFNETQNGLIKDLAKKMETVGTVMIVLAVLGLIGGVFAMLGSSGAGSAREAGRAVGVGFSNIIQGVIVLFVGLWTRKAGGSFNLIVKTQGNDVENLMGALGELRKLYNLQYWLILISLVFVALAIVLSFISASVNR